MQRSSLIGLLLIALCLGVLSSGTATPLTVPSSPFRIGSPTPGIGLFFGSSDGPSDFLTIDPIAATGTLVGPMLGSAVPPVTNFRGLAADPLTGFVYAGGPSVGQQRLYLVDPGSGMVAPVGTPTGGPFYSTIDALDFDFDGRLFGAVHNLRDNGRNAADHLATYDLTTGNITIVGPFGTCPASPPPVALCSIEGITALAFDTAGTLWAAKGNNDFPANGDLGLYTVDPSTGTATFVGPILDGAAIPPTGGIQSLQFACGGTLFGGTGDGYLVTIDRVTRQFASVGNNAVTPIGNGLVGLAASMPECGPGDSANALLADLDALVAVGTIDQHTARPLQEVLKRGAAASAQSNLEQFTTLMEVADTLVGIGEHRGRISTQTADGLHDALQRIIDGL